MLYYCFLSSSASIHCMENGVLCCILDMAFEPEQLWTSYPTVGGLCFLVLNGFRYLRSA